MKIKFNTEIERAECERALCLVLLNLKKNVGKLLKDKKLSATGKAIQIGYINRSVVALERLHNAAKEQP